MAAEKSPGKPTTRRYTDTEKAQAVRLVHVLREGRRHRLHLDHSVGSRYGEA